MYQVFWQLSAYQRLDAKRFRSVFERTKKGYPKDRVPPEETSTVNFAARLASHMQRQGNGGVVVLHNKRVESTSGADIEMAIEVAPGQWVDLVLQAKRVFPGEPGKPSSYTSWNVRQLKKLRAWTQGNGRAVCGVLLYNDTTEPFAPPRSSRKVRMGGCCQGQLTCKGGTKAPMAPPSPSSPMAITWAPTWPSVFGAGPIGSKPKAADVNRVAQPIECLFCPGNALVQHVATNLRPAWASYLMQVRDTLKLEGNNFVLETHRQQGLPRASIVIPFSEEDSSQQPSDDLSAKLIVPRYGEAWLGPHVVDLDREGNEIAAYWALGDRLLRGDRSAVEHLVDIGTPREWIVAFLEGGDE